MWPVRVGAEEEVGVACEGWVEEDEVGVGVACEGWGRGRGGCRCGL